MRAETGSLFVRRGLVRQSARHARLQGSHQTQLNPYQGMLPCTLSRTSQQAAGIGVRLGAAAPAPAHASASMAVAAAGAGRKPRCGATVAAAKGVHARHPAQYLARMHRAGRQVHALQHALSNAQALMRSGTQLLQALTDLLHVPDVKTHQQALKEHSASSMIHTSASATSLCRRALPQPRHIACFAGKSCMRAGIAQAH